MSEFTFQDLLSSFESEAFIGRAEQLQAFERLFTAPKPPFLIMAVSGQGGVGKSTLLKQFQNTTRLYGAYPILTNEEYRTILAVLNYFVQQLEEQGLVFSNYKEGYKRYEQLKDRLLADPAAPRGRMEIAFHSAVQPEAHYVDSRETMGELKSHRIKSKQAGELTVSTVNLFEEYVKRQFPDQGDRRLLLETDDELTRHFMTDLDQALARHRIVFFFDTYEETAHILDLWLRQLLLGKFGRFRPNVFFVIAGRLPIGQPWMPFRAAVRQFELDRFTEEEAKAYLQGAGITDEEEIWQLISISERLPVLLAFLVSAPGTALSDVSGTAVERFLHKTTDTQREAAFVGSIARYFNLDILRALLGDEVVEDAFDWLTQAHFVKPGRDGWVYHQVVRSLLMKHLRLRSPEQFIALHKKLAQHYEQQRELCDLSGSQKSSFNPAWIKNQIEYFYHTLCQNSVEGWTYGQRVNHTSRF